MAPPKLTEADKQEILRLYPLPGETTSSLARRYGVTPTTIGRVLQKGLGQELYDTLVQQKQQNRFGRGSAEEPEARMVTLETAPESIPATTQGELSFAQETPAVATVEIPQAPENPETSSTEESLTPASRSWRRKRSSAASAATEPALPTQQLPLLDVPTSVTQEESQQSLDSVASSEPQSLEPDAKGPVLLSRPTKPAPIKVNRREQATEMEPARSESSVTESTYSDRPSASTVPPDLEDELDLEDDDLEDSLASFELDDLDDEGSDLDDEEYGDEDEDEEIDEGEDGDDGELAFPRAKGLPESLVQVLPFDPASVPKSFYLVVDRAAELITRPLRDFGELGRIPVEEVQERTLPIFDNHRIARRFSKKTQRVVKVPDGRMLTKASPYLQAKGITRLLIDGQVYSL